METTPCVTLPLLKSIQELLDPVKRNEEINAKMIKLKGDIDHDRGTLPKPPTDMLAFIEGQEVTSDQLELAEKCVEYARAMDKIQKNQNRYDDFHKAYGLSSLEITKLREQIASNFGVSGGLLDLLMELVSAGLIKKDLIFKKEIKSFDDIKNIDSFKKKLAKVQKKMDKNQVDLEKIGVMERDPKIDYKRYKFWLLDCERAEKFYARDISDLKQEIESAEINHEDDMMDRNSEIREADSEFQVHIDNVKSLCSLDSAILDDFFKVEFEDDDEDEDEDDDDDDDDDEDEDEDE
jgi:hypothetical protein